jgi:hypothetical protein
MNHTEKADAAAIDAQQRAISDYLSTGHIDSADVFNWPGPGYMAQEANAYDALRDALVAEVVRRAGKAVLPKVPAQDALIKMTRGRVKPMVRGLFPRAEQDAILRLLEGSVVFLTPDNIENVLRNEGFPNSAWTIANVYLSSVDAEPLGGKGQGLLGLSQETTCFVTAKYLEGREDFDDFLVHEAAHVFHNQKREFVGLPYTRNKEWLLPIEYTKRETFAYSCEAYSRIVERSQSPKDRLALFEQYAETPYDIADLDVDEHVDILREAVNARNGWKRILMRCAPERSQQQRSMST